MIKYSETEINSSLTEGLHESEEMINRIGISTPE